MATQFTYTISSETANGEVAPEKLREEIWDSTITIAVDSITTNNGTLTIDFKANLSAGEETTLDALVLAHDGVPSVEDVQRFVWVDGDGNKVGSVLDGSTRRIALDFGDSTLTGPAGPTGPTGPTGPQGPAGGVSEYYFDSSDGTSSTTSGSYQQKLRLTTPSLPSGDYEIAWYYEVYTSDLDMNHRVQLNDSTTLAEGEHTSADEGDKHYWEPQSGFYIAESISGVQNIDIDYNDDGGGTAQIRRARLKIMKVD